MKMEGNDELKEIDIKNRKCYYFNDIMKVEDIDLYNILLDKKLYENNLVYNILCKTFIGAKLFRIRFDEVYGIIKIYDGARYLELFGSWFYNRICDKINYIIGEKNIYKYGINHNFSRITIDSYNFLPIEKIPTFHYVIILIKSVVNKNKINSYFNTFLEKS